MYFSIVYFLESFRSTINTTKTIKIKIIFWYVFKSVFNFSIATPLINLKEKIL